MEGGRNILLAHTISVDSLQFWGRYWENEPPLERGRGKKPAWAGFGHQMAVASKTVTPHMS
jgi:hypothetical protein